MGDGAGDQRLARRALQRLRGGEEARDDEDEPDLRFGQERVDDEDAGEHHLRDPRPHQEGPPVHVVGEGTSVEPEDDERDQLDQADRADDEVTR